MPFPKSVLSFMSPGEGFRFGLHTDLTLWQTTTAPPITNDAPEISGEYYGLFTSDNKKADSHEEKKTKMIRLRMIEGKGIKLQDTLILYALRSAHSSGDPDKAFDLLLAISDSWEGLLTDYNPSIKMLGSENRESVTCYLDSILFAMFSRLDSFEAILHNDFGDTPRNRLAMLLRLWVNLLRSGKLITTEITKLLQESLAECGWEDAAEIRQQDASEAFTFITEKLELPLLTLKMDIYHTGSEDSADDHKFINERLLEVAIPPDHPESRTSIPLEDCLEAYFNNRIEVKRHMERRTTINSLKELEASASYSPELASINVAAIEIKPETSSPVPDSATSTSSSPALPHRTPSFVQHRFFPDRGGPKSPPAYEAETKKTPGRPRSGSLRKEVMMPAWQFFSLLPWYTNNKPRNDAQVASHFTSQRPILGMCLKRYTFTENGNAIRLDTRIDIPTEIGLPHFISDENMGEDGPIYGNFKLSLQSVVCHRGTSVHSGHYISLIKGTNLPIPYMPGATPDRPDDSNQWIRFDDTASERVTLINIHQALKTETPYLLFYQIVPIDIEPTRSTDEESLPAYAPSEAHDSGVAGMSETSSKIRSSSDETPPRSHLSVEVTASDAENARGRSPLRAKSSDASSNPQPPPQATDLTIPEVTSTSKSTSRRGSTHTKSRTQSRSQSQTGEKRRPFSMLKNRKSREAVSSFAPANSSPAAGPMTLNLTPKNSMEGLPGQAGLVPEEGNEKGSEKGKGFLWKAEGRREKSRSRLSGIAMGKASAKGSSAGKKEHGDHPDRECSVM